MSRIHNPFKQALQAGKPQIGLWLSMANAYATEVCASCGFDWLLIDGEHSPNDIPMVLASLQAAAAYPSHPVARVPVADATLIKQYLDIGVQTILVPMVDTAAQAQQMVQAMRYPPQGIRGIGAGGARVSRFGTDPNYVLHANEDVCLLVQTETKTAIDNLDAICAVEGVDGVFFGPSDLSASLGHLGAPGHPEVHKVILDSIRRVRAAGKAPGILTPDEKLAREYLDAGALFVSVGLDIRLLTMHARALAARFKTS